jgi:hypothetical protein
VHVVLLLIEICPGGHVIHEVTEVAPTVELLYVPSGQDVHEPAPVDELYVPIGQLRHAVTEAAPVVALYVPDGQLRQAEIELAPVVALYVPAGQDVQKVLDGYTKSD